MPFTHYKTITIDHTQCGASDSLNFPLALVVTDADLQTTPAGKVTSANGFDIRPYNSARTTPLDFELVAYDGATGTIELHVRLPTLSASVNTVITLCFGNSALTTNGSASTTWDSGFVGVWHFGDGVTLGLTDSSQAANAAATATAGATTGQLRGGVTFRNTATPETYVVPTSPSLSTLSTAFTCECWVKPANLSQTSAWLWAHSSANLSNAYYSMVLTGAAVEYYGAPYTYGKFSSGPTSVLTLPDTGWHHVAYTFDGTTWCRYLDGALIGTGTAAGTLATTTITAVERLTLGSIIPTSTGSAVLAALDELRVSHVVRSADWFTAQVNNQKAGTSMVTLGLLTATTAVLTVTGSAGPTGVATKRDAPRLWGVTAPTALAARLTGHAATGVSVLIGTASGLAAHPTQGGIAPTGTSARQAQPVRTARVQPVPTRVRDVGRIRTVLLALSGTPRRLPAHAAIATLALAGELPRTVVGHGQTGAVAVAGEARRQLRPARGGQVTPWGTRHRDTEKAGDALLDPTSTIHLIRQRLAEGVLGLLGTVTAAVGQAIRPARLKLPATPSGEIQLEASRSRRPGGR